MDNKLKTCYVRLSQATPESVRKLLFCDVGEKLEDKLFNNFNDLNDCYPDFHNWFYKKVFYDIDKKNDTREILMAISVVEDSYQLTGVAILKKTFEEKKICTIKVNKKYRHKGIGSMLFEESFKYLGTRQPMITFSSNVIEMFKPYIKKYNFKLMQKLDGYYKKGIIEYVYNGKLK